MTEETNAKGRKSEYAGMHVRPLISDNPRRAGTHGHSSFAVLLDHPDGMPYEDFIAAGGRRNDLDFDLKRDRAEVYNAETGEVVEIQDKFEPKPKAPKKEKATEQAAA